MGIRDGLVTTAAWVVFTTALLGGIRLYNSAWNNKTIDNPGYKTESRASGIFGHVEFTTYSDNSHDVKTYPGLIDHRYFNSQLNQDLDGDGLVDRIRRDGSEFRMHSLKKILTRENDYEKNKELFDKTDKQLQDLILKYPNKYLISK